MPIRARLRRRLFWPHCQHWGGGPYGPPGPWWTERPSQEEEVEYFKEYIEFLKEEQKAAEEHLKELEQGK
jgi:hypothetical protein